MAAGAKTFKLKYGHRSHNQPVKATDSNRCYITAQNHGYAVDTTTLSKDWEPIFTNMNDDTNEGIRHKSKKFFSTQFYPDMTGDPKDTSYLFDIFLTAL
jgi:carbamoylphosphate synthase small subunit